MNTVRCVSPRRIIAFLPAIAVTLGAFLLFLIEPFAGKLLLPWFGGVPAVWVICMLFFQGMLLAGYCYAHWLSCYLTPKRRSLVHLLLVGLTLLWLPPLLSAHWQPQSVDMPALRILWRLVLMLGGPFLVLATTAPLTQVWHGALRPGRSPYRLYALSNAGALLALLAYPFVIEPRLTLNQQGWIWSAGYLLYGACVAATVWSVRKSTAAEIPAAPEQEQVSIGRHLLWFFAPLIGCVLLLAITNEITQDIAVVPFLWILPLAMYLLSYVLCFEGSGWYQRLYYVPLCLACIALLHHTSWLHKPTTGVIHDTVVWCLTLFSFCMVCHGEVERAKPGAPLLTRYYLLVAAGGAAGGLFVGIVAPLLFHGYPELPWTLAAALALPAFPIALGLQLAKQLKVVVAAAALCAAVAAGVYLQTESALRGTVLTEARNFYGSVRILDEYKGQEKHFRTMQHGRIIHGLQFMAPKYRELRLGYMGSRSGAALGIFYHGKPAQRRFGVIGLGTGTVAAFALPGDTVRFYEINPLVIRYAKEYFTYVKDAKAEVTIVEGDGRLALAQEPLQQFDYLFLDAFSGDSPPVHLLTEEAFQIYLEHLDPAGALFVHISNRYIDFAPLLWRMADRFNMHAVVVDSAGDREWNIFSSAWMIITNNENILNGSEIAASSRPRRDLPGLRLWTDSYSSLLPLIFSRSDIVRE